MVHLLHAANLAASAARTPETSTATESADTLFEALDQVIAKRSIDSRRCP